MTPIPCWQDDWWCVREAHNSQSFCSSERITSSRASYYLSLFLFLSIDRSLSLSMMPPELPQGLVPACSCFWCKVVRYLRRTMSRPKLSDKCFLQLCTWRSFCAYFRDMYSVLPVQLKKVRSFRQPTNAGCPQKASFGTCWGRTSIPILRGTPFGCDTFF